jgi:plastocyanin
MKSLALFGAAMCLVAAVATACGGSTTTEKTSSATATATTSPTSSAPATPTASAPAAAGAATITIAKMDFGEPVTVSPGAQVTIKNNDSVEHSVTSDTSGQFNVDVEANEQGTLTAPAAAGEYQFHCTYHPSMHGTLIVK